MLELTTKWMTNTLAKKSIQTNDFIKCANESKLYILSYGEITSSGKNTYNYKFVDSEGKESEGSNAYLDLLTKLILGYNQKSKANKEEGTKQSAKASNNLFEEYKRLEANLKKAILAFNDFKVLHNITTLKDASEAQSKAQKERREAKQKERREEVAILKRIATLRKWSKDTKRLDLLQALNDKLLAM